MAIASNVSVLIWRSRGAEISPDDFKVEFVNTPVNIPRHIMSRHVARNTYAALQVMTLGQFPQGQVCQSDDSIPVKIALNKAPVLCVIVFPNIVVRIVG